MAHAYREGDEPIPKAGYRLTGYLGRGGFGEVWKASTPGGAEAAVKIIRLGGAEGRKEFRALQLVKRIRHPNLMPLMAFWLKSADGSVLDDALAEQAELSTQPTADDSFRETSLPPEPVALPPAELIIVMGLGDTPLIDRLQQCRAEGREGIPVEELLGYMEDAAEALDFLNSPVHKGGAGPVAIQHCDIKPHNLMIVGGGVQVCDFGLARMMGVERATTGAASIAYAAPELLDGNTISPSTDQYSLALTYFELRTGKLPYVEETVAAVLEAKRQETLDFSACPKAEQEVLRRATARDPLKRFPSSLEMVRALRRAAAAGPDATTAESSSVRPRRRRGLLAFAGGLVLASLLGAAGWAAWWNFGQKTDVPTGPPKAEAAVADTGESIAVDDPLDRGTKLLEQSKFDEAIPELAKAASQLPGNVRPLSRLGAAWFGKAELKNANGNSADAAKDYQTAIDKFTQAIKIQPGAVDYVARGRSRRGLNQNDAAMDDFNEAIRLNASSAAAHYWRGDCNYELGQFEEAVSDFNHAIKLSEVTPDPTFTRAEAYASRGMAYFQGEHAEKAVPDFIESNRLRPGNAAVCHTLAAAYDKAGELGKAIIAEKMAIENAVPGGADAKEFRDQLAKYEKRLAASKASSK
jgi:serine/threonine protein kinase/tetratricopeptide (TPR) repeat protein